MVKAYQAGGIRIETIGIDKVSKSLLAFSKASQAKAGLAVKKQAENQKEMTKELILTWNVFDTGVLHDAIDTIKTGPYEWIVGDLNYPTGIFPYGKWIEYGITSKHWIHRSQINEFSNKLAWFLESDREFLKVGPMLPRPVFSTAREMVIFENKEEFEKKIKEAIEESFK